MKTDMNRLGTESRMGVDCTLCFRVDKQWNFTFRVYGYILLFFVCVSVSAGYNFGHDVTIPFKKHWCGIWQFSGLPHQSVQSKKVKAVNALM